MLALCILFIITILAGGSDKETGGTSSPYWPQFHGPKRDNISTDKNLLKRWPEGGPKLLWKTQGIGKGYSTVSICSNMIYTAGNIGDDTVITAMDMNGEILWQKKNGPAWKHSTPGSRSTPTIYKGKLYHLNSDLDIICLNAKSGKLIWTLNALKKFNGRKIRWGIAECLLVDGQKVFCSVGGTNISLVALDKDTGKTIWTCRGIGDKPGYASPTIVDYKGLRQLVTLMSASAVGVEIETGRLLWKYPHPVKFDENILCPLFIDGHIFICASHRRGSTLLKLNVEGKNCSVEEVWRTEELDNQHGGVIIANGYLFGYAEGNHKYHWACLEFKTGRTMYSGKGLPGKSTSITFADGMLYLLSEQGTVALMPPDPKKFKPVSTFQLPKTERRVKNWAHPVVCGGRLYLRSGNYLYAFDVRKH